MLRVADGQVASARFTGDSCAICTASADVVAESVEGKAAAEAVKMTSEDVLTILQTDVRPTRLRCVTLPLTVLQQALSR
jgi:NifU-like protein involved in Fe-S cluster formation